MVTSERKMNELISKQKAIDEIKEFQSQVTCDFSKDWLNGMNEGFAHSIKVIELIDTEEAEPVRRGHWIPKYDKWGDYVTTVECYECSACKETNWDEDKYCPWCGAKMDERSEE